MYFVLYQDGYCDSGDHGWESFSEEADALKFIEGRLADHVGRILVRDYTLIKGEAIPLKAVEMVRRIARAE